MKPALCVCVHVCVRMHMYVCVFIPSTGSLLLKKTSWSYRTGFKPNISAGKEIYHHDHRYCVKKKKKKKLGIYNKRDF